jgi:nucleoside-diphosphate-sugar epimerase
MKVLVTGATGFVGAHSAAAMQAAGHELRLLVRDPDRAHRVGAIAGFRTGDLVIGDMRDPAIVARAVHGCDALLHAAAVVALDRRRAAAAVAANVEGSTNVLLAGAREGLRRIIHVSSTSALSSSAGRLSADSPVSPMTGYAASKAGVELIARELAACGAPVHITYPAGVLGPAAGGSLGETSTGMARFAASGFLPTPGAALSVIDVRDLAAIHLALLERATAPGRIMCGGTCLSMYELGQHLRALTGRRFPVLPLPPAAWRFAGRLADSITSIVPLRLTVTEEAMTLVTTWQGTDDNATEALGVTRRPVVETLAAALDAWVEAGLLRPDQGGRARLRSVL